MEEFKRENFKKDFPNVNLQVDIIENPKKEQVLQNLQIDKILEKIKKQEYIFSLKYYKEIFFKKLIRSKQINTNELIVFNLNFSDMYTININQLVNYFEYVWYEGADDLLIFDYDKRWVIYVAHYGNISCLDISIKKEPKK